MNLDRTVFCIAEGNKGAWEAFCIDFDLAVQGQSFDEVYRKMHEQIELYIEGVTALPRADQERLLSRRAPFHVWLPAMIGAFWHALRRSSREVSANFPVHIGKVLAAA